MSNRLTLVAAALMVAFGAIPSADAQEWPTRGPITLVVPYNPGAGNDLLGRLTAEHLTPRLGQQVVVENRPGAGSMIGLESVANGTPDGYTILWSPSDGMTMAPALRKTMPYTVPDDFSFLGRIAQMGFVVAVHPDSPINSMDDLIKYAKENPGRLRYGSSGVGGAPHLGPLMLGAELGLDMVHVPYSGLSLAITDLIGGHIDMVWITPVTARKHFEAGTIKVFAQTGDDRHPVYAKYPTLRELGIDVRLDVFYGMFAPPGTPEPILEKLRDALADYLADPAVKARYDELGYTIAWLRGEEFKKAFVEELEHWRAVAKQHNIVLED